MVERFQRQSALAPLGLAARAATAPGGAGVLLSERGFLGQVALRGSGDPAFVEAAAAALGLAPPLEPNRVGERGRVRMLWLGPDEWLVVTPDGKAEALAKKLLEKLQGQAAAVVEVSEARAVIGLAGPRARDVLSHGCSLDLHPRAFGPGRCAQTLLSRVPIILDQRDGAPSYDIYVHRSFAEHLWGWLEDAGAGYGVAVVGG
jgi:sarcosine oxidase subunit gamma